MDQSIGDLFREHGEDYIRIYKPPIQHIKLIRAIRICRTPFFGGKMLRCKKCDYKQYIYLSCGHSHCPLCQNNKRQLWQAKLASKMYNVPYVHGVFTTPRELHPLMRRNKSVLYNIVIRAAWETVKQLSADPKNVGGLPGMVTVLHTFGSDMKYHVHVHALITFGGLGSDNKWYWPKRKKRLASYREMSKKYREIFIKKLRSAHKKGELETEVDVEALISEIEKKRWNVRMEYPTADTEVLERYLARYVNRVAITKNRLQYVSGKEKIDSVVQVQYKDYNKQKKGEAAPIEMKRIEPLVAISKFMQHVLPPYFQKTRYYGLHSSPTRKRLEGKIPKEIIGNKETIKKVFELLTHMNGLSSYKCEKCESTDFEITEVRPDKTWIFYFVTKPSYRGPPKMKRPKTVQF